MCVFWYTEIRLIGISLVSAEGPQTWSGPGGRPRSPGGGGAEVSPARYKDVISLWAPLYSYSYFCSGFFFFFSFLVLIDWRVTFSHVPRGTALHRAPPFKAQNRCGDVMQSCTIITEL